MPSCLHSYGTSRGKCGKEMVISHNETDDWEKAKEGREEEDDAWRSACKSNVHTCNVKLQRL